MPRNGVVGMRDVKVDVTLSSDEHDEWCHVAKAKAVSRVQYLVDVVDAEAITLGIKKPVHKDGERVYRLCEIAFFINATPLGVRGAAVMLGYVGIKASSDSSRTYSLAQAEAIAEALGTEFEPL